MLAKLIKYDFKYVNKFLILIHAVLLLACIIGRFLITNRVDNFYSDRNIVLFIIAFTLYIVLFMGAAYGTLIIITIRFYKNMFSDEGYLTHTLPVTRSQHLLSKTFVGFIWQFIDCIVIYGSGFLLIATPLVIENVTRHKAELLEEFGCTQPGDFRNMLILLLVLTLVSSVSSVIMIYLSIIIGQLFNSHRVIAAIVTYFVLNTIFSVLAFIVMILNGTFTSMLIMEDAALFNPYDYFMDVSTSSLILAFVTTIICYIAAHLLLKKKLNLN